MNDPENRNSVIPKTESKTKKRKPKIPFEELKDTPCCNLECNELIFDNLPYFEYLREEAQKNNKNKRKTIKDMLYISNIERKTCRKFIIQVLGISKGTLKKVNDELMITADEGQPATNYLLQSRPRRTRLAQRRYASQPNQRHPLRPMADTINNSRFQPNDVFTSYRVNDIPVSTERRYQHIIGAVYRELNDNPNNLYFSQQYSNYQPNTNHNIQGAQIHAYQNLGQQFSGSEFVNHSVNQMEFHNNLQQQVQSQNFEYRDQRIQQTLIPDRFDPRICYQIMMVSYTNINIHQTDVNIQDNDNIVVLVRKNNDFTFVSPAALKYMNLNRSPYDYIESHDRIHII
ncbi:hypothetical protein RF11_03939 [Thelohanellus kitauei]|uniref:Uncharacterized protein n=1 Tax=Thelohanellus kitauei TaxID=669202 RepID=A0A0C2J7U5_THEKT|nr:hypothetical protein RF11_03939 [Thelohanellus kitauei]